MLGAAVALGFANWRLAIVVKLFKFSHLARSRRVPVAACGLAAALFVCPAFAAESDTLKLALSDTFSYNSNLLRTAGSAGPLAGFSTKADRVNVVAVALKLDKQYAQQRVQFDVTKSAARYDVYSYLNADTLNYRGAWLWTLTPHITGTLSADQTQAQIPFVTSSGTQRNLQTTDNQSFKMDARVSGGWHLLAGVGQSESTTEQAILGTPSFKSRRVEAGARYVTVAGNSITFLQRVIPTDLSNQPLDAVNLIDTNYRDTESELKVIWKPSASSSFDGTLTRKERRNEHFAQRDFTGIASDLRYTWTPMGKLTFNVSAMRNILPYVAYGNTLENSTYSVDQSLSLESVWQAASKTAVRFSYVRVHSDFRGAVLAIAGPARSDEYHRPQLGVDWIPTRYLSLSAGLEQERRSSNVANFEFTNTIATLRAALTF